MRLATPAGLLLGYAPSDVSTHDNGDSDSESEAEQAESPPDPTASTGSRRFSMALPFEGRRASQALLPTAVQGNRRGSITTPAGVVNALQASDADVALRLFLLDNSSSTRMEDGHVLTKDEHGELKDIEIDRWGEIRCIALSHAELNSRYGVRTQMVLLNPKCPSMPVEGQDFVTVDPAKGNSKEQIAAVTEVLRKYGPCGNSPLTCRLKQMRLRLQREKDFSATRRYTLTIVTDGLPTSTHSTESTQLDKEQFVKELRTWGSSIKCQLVIRLTTGNTKVLQYYRRVEDEMASILTVLDDLQSEAKKVYAHGNKWLTYTPLLHRLREGGTSVRVLNSLGERRLEFMEVAQMLDMLLRRPEDHPFPLSSEGLYEAAEAAAALAPSVYNGRLDCLSPPVDLKQLKKTLGPSIAERMTTAMARAVACSVPELKLPSPNKAKGLLRPRRASA